MKKIFFFLVIFSQLICAAQITQYKKRTAMIPMRDGIKLFTVIYTPVNAKWRLTFNDRKNSLWRFRF